MELVEINGYKFEPVSKSNGKYLGLRYIPSSDVVSMDFHCEEYINEFFKYIGIEKTTFMEKFNIDIDQDGTFPEYKCSHQEVIDYLQSFGKGGEPNYEIY